MHTPEHDFDLAARFLVSQGAVHTADHNCEIRYCAGTSADGANTYNIVDVNRPGFDAGLTLVHTITRHAHRKPDPKPSQQPRLWRPELITWR